MDAPSDPAPTEVWIGPLEPQPPLEFGQQLDVMRDYIMDNYPTVAAAQTREELVIALRTLLHMAVPRRPTTGFDFDQPLNAFRMSVHEQGPGHGCGGLTIVFLQMLAAFKIPARFVGMFSHVDENLGAISGHATSEVFIDGVWTAQDATFNCSFKDEAAQYLSWSDVRARLMKQGRVLVTTNDQGVREPAYHLHRYYLPLHKQIDYGYIGPWRGEDGKLKKHRLLGKWNGVLTYFAGSFDYHLGSSSGVYSNILKHTVPAMP